MINRRTRSRIEQGQKDKQGSITGSIGWKGSMGEQGSIEWQGSLKGQGSLRGLGLLGEQLSIKDQGTIGG